MLALGAKGGKVVQGVGKVEDYTWGGEFVFRKDTRGSEIFDSGFIAKKPESKVQLESYVEFGLDSNFISTTKYKDIAENFSISGISTSSKEGYVFVINKGNTGRDVNQEFPANPNYRESEVVYEGKIDPRCILGCYKVDTDGKPTGGFITNPKYKREGD